MDNVSSKGYCQTMCWFAAAVAGVLATFVLHGPAHWAWVGAAFIGLLIVAIGGFLLANFVCADALPRSFVAPLPMAAAGRNATTSMVPTLKPTMVAGPITSTTHSAAATPATMVVTAEASAAPKADAPGMKASPVADPFSAQPPVAADGKPAMLAGPRSGTGDDLKQIKGVGPKLEQMLNTMGVWHFDQIASWREPEVRWADQNLEGFKGRVSRDHWVSQARVLADSGTTEFSTRMKKGGDY